ncbi:hypothetical protein JXA80_14365 [bacterium]|nr:hypothetical protein [candidate division CSSED10-310 bacterium]
MNRLIFSLVVSGMGLVLIPMMVQAGSGGIPSVEEVRAAIDAAGAAWIASDTGVQYWWESGSEFDSASGSVPGSVAGLGGILPDSRGVPVMDPILMWSRLRDRGRQPSDHDWRSVDGTNWMTPVKNQMNCGACAAFASLGCLEAVIRIASADPGIDIDLSEQHLFSCAGGDCPTGLYMGDAFTYIAENGVPDEKCLPYTAVDDNCADTCTDWQDQAETIDRWDLLWQYTVDIEALKAFVAEQPVACYMEVYGDFMSYQSGVYEHVTGNLLGGHFVVVIGWNDADGCWICKNSWGIGWGEEGYFRIRYGETSIGTWAMVPDYTSTVVTPTPRPTATPTPVMELGVTLTMPHTSFAAGDDFYLDAVICNPGMPIHAVPLCVLLEAGGLFWCWPGWQPLASGFECSYQDIPLGKTTRVIIAPFVWPDVPSAGVELVFWGAMLDPHMQGLLGELDRVSWTY